MIFNLMNYVPIETPTDTPTMYLYGHEAEKTVSYNGVELPDINEVWADELKAQYPYAVIWQTQGFWLFETLIVSAEPPTIDDSSVYFGECLVISQNVDDSWGDSEEKSDLTYTIKAEEDHKPIWCNTNLNNTDGTVYLSASEPVVTYENADITIDGVGYVGVVLPKLPEWDKEQYPYAAIEYTTLYVLSNEVTQTNGYFGGTRTFKAPFMKASLTVSDTISWREFEVGESDETAMFGLMWANHNVLDNEGATHFEESTTIPVSLPLTIFESEVTLKQSDYSDNAGGSISGVLYGYKLGDTLRITLNGDSAIYHATKASTYNGIIVGNNGLNGNDPEGIDDGGDILLSYPHFIGSTGWGSYIYIRTPGTHYVKIELLEES